MWLASTRSLWNYTMASAIRGCGRTDFHAFSRTNFTHARTHETVNGVYLNAAECIYARTNSRALQYE